MDCDVEPETQMKANLSSILTGHMSAFYCVLNEQAAASAVWKRPSGSAELRRSQHAHGIDHLVSTNRLTVKHLSVVNT